MPTGYTAAITEGEGVTLRQFMLKCVRAMGVCIELRDAPWDAPIPKGTEPSSSEIRHEGSIVRVTAEIEKLEALTDTECDAQAEEDYREALISHEKRMEEGRLQKARYEAMLAQVEAWVPPTPDHENYKKFMIDQIQESVRFDCAWLDDPSRRLPPVREEGESWRELRLEAARDNLTYHQKGLAKARENQAANNAWLTALWASLPLPQPYDQIAYVTRDEGDAFSAFASDGTFVCKVPESTATRWPETASNGA